MKLVIQILHDGAAGAANGTVGVPGYSSLAMAIAIGPPGVAAELPHE